MTDSFKYPVDAVYLWVDGEDPLWLERKHEAMRSNGLQDENLESTTPARYRDNSELRYSLRSLARYAPWVNTVYIITDRQCPGWINPDTVKLVDHKEILPECAAYPVFSNRPIELCMHRVPGLSEHFLAFNDDFMLGGKVSSRDFFSKEGKPLVWASHKAGKPDNAHEILQNPESNPRDRSNAFTRLSILKRTGSYLSHKIKHYPRACCKQSIEAMWQKFPEEITHTLKQQFRGDRDFNMFPGYGLYLLAAEQGLPFFINGLYQFTHLVQGKIYHIGTSLGDHNCKTKACKIKYLHPKTFCINDAPKAGEKDREWFEDYLNGMFPEKSKYEL